MVELADVVLKAVNPASLLRMAVTSFLLTLTDELCKVLDKVPNFRHAESRDCGMNHANDGRGEGS